MNKIKGFRCGCDISQKEMADKLGISIPTYIKLECGKGNWSKDLMEKYIKAVQEKYPEATVDEIFFK